MKAFSIALAAPESAQHSERQSLIPPLFRQMSVASLLLLAARWGGQRVFVPRGRHETSPLNEVLSPSEFAALRAERGGELITVPRMAALTRSLRDDKILALRAEGKPVRDVALLFKMTERNVHYICAHRRTNDRQRSKR